jgi:hypothetical protein
MKIKLKARSLTLFCFYDFEKRARHQKREFPLSPHRACMGDRKVQMKVKTAALVHPSWDYTFINSSEGFSSISFQTIHLF